MEGGMAGGMDWKRVSSRERWTVRWYGCLEGLSVRMRYVTSPRL